MLIAVSIIFLLAGAFTGILSGLLGIGGGVIFVPLQILIFQLMGVPLDIQMKLAVGTALAAIIFTSLSASIGHSRRGSIFWQIIYEMGLGIILGAILGAILARIMPAKLLEVIFGIGIIGLGFYFFLLHAHHEEVPMELPNYFVINILGFLIGTISAMIGLGGGTLTVPTLLYLKVPFRKTLGTANVVSCIVSFFGVIPFLIPGLEHGQIYEYSLGYVYFPSLIPLAIGAVLAAPFGVQLAHRIPRRILKPIFAILLMIVGLVMIFR